MTTGKPLRLIINFAIPIILGNLVQQLYNAADSVMVGKLIGNDALGAVGSTGSITFLIIGFIMGLSEGACMLVARFFGGKDYEKMKHCVGNIIYVLFGVVIVFTALSFTFSREILILMKTPKELLPLADTYIRVIFLGMCTNMLYNFCAGLLRALGDSRSPLYFLIISAVLNVALNYLFIAIIPLGVLGAAIATVLAQLFSGLCCIIHISKKCDYLRISRCHLKPDARLIGRICGMGLPMGFQYSIVAIGSVTLQAAINSLGNVAVTAYATCEKVLNPCWSLINCMGVALANFCSQNLGAGNLPRVKKGVRDAGALMLSLSVAFALLLFFFGKYASLIFLDEKTDEIFAYISQYFKTQSFFFIALSFIGILRNTVQGLGFSMQAMFGGVLELFARSTIALVFVPIYGFDAACFASPSAWVVAAILFIFLYIYAIKKLSKKQVELY